MMEEAEIVKNGSAKETAEQKEDRVKAMEHNCVVPRGHGVQVGRSRLVYCPVVLVRCVLVAERVEAHVPPALIIRKD